MRQKQLLDDERKLRAFSSMSGAALSALFVPPVLSLVCCVVLLVSEVLDDVAYKRLRDFPNSRSALPFLLIIAAVGDAAFILPAVLMWFTGQPLAQFVSILMLVGGLMNVTMVRAIYLPLGFANAMPLVVAMIAVQVTTFAPRGWTYLIGALLFTALFLNYFLSAYLSNYRLQKELHDARDVAIARSESQTRFVANMSHELRTPLNAIMGLSRALNEGNPTTEMELILAKARHMSLLVEDLLDLSAIEVGVLKVEPAPCDIHQALREIKEEWHRVAAEKAIGFELNIAQDVPRVVMVDIARLRQCVNNLLTNAIRFTEAGYVSLHLDRHPVGLEIAVCDTGPGLPLGAEERLFLPYQQFSENATMRHGGSGLGLAISHGLARTMQGELRLDRSYALGACFRMSFAAPLAELPPKASHATKKTLHGKTFMVIDDVPTNRLVIRLLLEPMGVTVIEAESGEAALASTELTKVDLILLDIHMPGLSGHTTFDGLRKLGISAPIVALSADAHFTQRDRAMSNGFSGYLTKPIELEALVDAVQTVLVS